MNSIFEKIKEMVPDLETAKLTFSYVMSQGEARERVLRLEKDLGGIVVFYHLSGKKLTIYFSPEMKEKWGDNPKGKKVRLEVKDVKGNIIKAMCREGEVTSEEMYFISGSRCVRCQFGKDNDAYDITNLVVLK